VVIGYPAILPIKHRTREHRIVPAQSHDQLQYVTLRSRPARSVNANLALQAVTQGQGEYAAAVDPRRPILDPYTPQRAPALSGRWATAVSIAAASWS
jgi:hypothetical protein